jgi:uncharacterized protein (DUF983 family)
MLAQAIDEGIRSIDATFGGSRCGCPQHFEGLRMAELETQSASPVSAALRCRCPRCGQGALFRRVLEVREACPKCALSYAFADAGDGPAVFAILLVGAIMSGLAIWTEVRHQPPMWLHAVLWVPVTLLLAWLVLPRLKALLIALQYRNRAEVGRLSSD